MYNKTITRFGFGDIPKNQGIGNCYQPRPLARLITLASNLVIPEFTKPHPIIVYYHYLLHRCYHYDYNNNNYYY